MRLLSALACGACALLLAASAHASKECVETSEVVGEQKCGRYADGWSSEGSLPLTLEVGLFRSTYGLAGRKFSGELDESNRGAYHFDGATAATTARTYGFTLRATAMLSPFVYLGLEQSMSFGRVEGAPFTAGDYGVTASPGVNAFAGTFGLPFGLRLPLGKISLRGEIFGGLTILSLRQQANGARADADWFGGVAESRGYLDFWLANDTTLSVMVGHDVLGRNDQRIGLVLRYHNRSYDGRYGF